MDREHNIINFNDTVDLDIPKIFFAHISVWIV